MAWSQSHTLASRRCLANLQGWIPKLWASPWEWTPEEQIGLPGHKHLSRFRKRKYSIVLPLCFRVKSIYCYLAFPPSRESFKTHKWKQWWALQEWSFQTTPAPWLPSWLHPWSILSNLEINHFPLYIAFRIPQRDISLYPAKEEGGHRRLLSFLIGSFFLIINKRHVYGRKMENTECHKEEKQNHL